MGGGARGGKKHPKIAKTGSLARGLGGSKYNLLAAGGGGGGGGGGVGETGVVSHEVGLACWGVAS